MISVREKEGKMSISVLVVMQRREIGHVKKRLMRVFFLMCTLRKWQDVHLAQVWPLKVHLS